MNMKSWLESLPESKKPLPILSFPSTRLIGATVYELTHSAEVQTAGIVKVAERVDSAAAVTMMDLSVEAEAFGCEIHAAEDEIPTVTGALVTDEDEADELQIPPLTAGRCTMYINAAAEAKKQITDRPTLAGIIGPFSLAGRIMDVSEALVNCLAEPDMVHKILKKTTAFLIEYAKGYKAAGLDGIVIAEPLSGLLSPALEEEFSSPYVQKLVESVRDDNFAVVYHNCGPNTPKMVPSLIKINADAYHFGDAVSMKEMLTLMPDDKPVCGNISPSAVLLSGNPELVKEKTRELMKECAVHKNFVLSSGCDIPPSAPWENIDAFFEAARE